MSYRFKIVKRKKIWRSRMILFSGLFLFSLGLILGSIFIFPQVKGTLRGSAQTKLEQQNMNVTPFNDVAVSDPNMAAIKYLKDRGAISGYSDSTFKPGDFLSRAQLVKMVVAANRAEPHALTNSYCFNDVKNEWHARYICFAKAKEWVTGFKDNSFKPDDNITKAEAIAIVEKSFGLSADALPVSELAGGAEMGSEITRGQACDILAKAMLKAGMD